MGSRSSSKTATTSNFYDQRQVNDAGGGIVGTGNSQDQSITLVDASTSVTTDAGAFKFASEIGRAQTDAAVQIGATGAQLGNSAIKLASDAQAAAIATVRASNSGAFDLAESSAARAYASSGEALAFGRSVLDAASGAVSSAYDSAADTSSGNKTLLYAGIAAVALVAVTVAFGAFRK